MLSVEEALSTIIQQVERPHAASVPLESALGLVLAEQVLSDIDSPPFDKALMDGYAVRSADISNSVRLVVREEILAGQVPRHSIGHGETARIMTGAPLPEGADAVVQLEHSRMDGEEAVILETTPTEPGRNILYRGSSVKAGQIVLNPGTELRPQQLGALAELGRSHIPVYPRPSVAVLATGDELVPVHEKPGPGQIRNSNETMLVTQLKFAGAEPLPIGIARDTREDLREKISYGLQADMLLLSGGVSAGKADLVPSVLQELGVTEIFHKVQIRPGQPLWFGVASGKSLGGQDSNRRCYVFGLPGNPVSSMVCCEVFVRTALRCLMGIKYPKPQPVRAVLMREHFNRGSRPTYHPASLSVEKNGFRVVTVPWVGSADLCATAKANAMVLFSNPDAKYVPGDVVDVFAW